MIRIKNPALPESSSPAWMLTFADLLSLVLTFFVLIIATAKPIIQGSIYDKTSETRISASTEETESQIKLQTGNYGDSINYLEKVIAEKFAADKDLANLNMNIDNEKLVINMSLQKFKDTAPKLARILKVVDNEIWVYSAHMDISAKALQVLIKAGLDKNIAIAQTAINPKQINIVIYP